MSDITEAFEVLAAAYPRDYGRYDEQQIDVWSSLFDDVEADLILKAARTLSKSSKWPPTVAEIREAAGCKTIPRTTITAEDFE